jgi:hypothetical protein
VSEVAGPQAGRASTWGLGGCPLPTLPGQRASGRYLNFTCPETGRSPVLDPHRDRFPATRNTRVSIRTSGGRSAKPALYSRAALKKGWLAVVSGHVKASFRISCRGSHIADGCRFRTPHMMQLVNESHARSREVTGSGDSSDGKRRAASLDQELMAWRARQVQTGDQLVGDHKLASIDLGQ